MAPHISLLLFALLSRAVALPVDKMLALSEDELAAALGIAATDGALAPCTRVVNLRPTFDCVIGPPTPSFDRPHAALSLEVQCRAAGRAGGRAGGRGGNAGHGHSHRGARSEFVRPPHRLSRRLARSRFLHTVRCAVGLSRTQFALSAGSFLCELQQHTSLSPSRSLSLVSVCLYLSLFLPPLSLSISLFPLPQVRVETTCDLRDRSLDDTFGGASLCVALSGPRGGGAAAANASDACPAAPATTTTTTAAPNASSSPSGESFAIGCFAVGESFHAYVDAAGELAVSAGMGEGVPPPLSPPRPAAPAVPLPAAAAAQTAPTRIGRRITRVARATIKCRDETAARPSLQTRAARGGGSGGGGGATPLYYGNVPPPALALPPPRRALLLYGLQRSGTNFLEVSR